MKKPRKRGADVWSYKTISRKGLKRVIAEIFLSWFLAMIFGFSVITILLILDLAIRAVKSR